MTQAGDRSTAGRVEDFLAIFEEDVASFAADGFLGDEAGVSMEDGAGRGKHCSAVSDCSKPCQRFELTSLGHGCTVGSR